MRQLHLTRRVNAFKMGPKTTRRPGSCCNDCLAGPISERTRQSDFRCGHTYDCGYPKVTAIVRPETNIAGQNDYSKEGKSPSSGVASAPVAKGQGHYYTTIRTEYDSGDNVSFAVGDSASLSATPVHLTLCSILKSFSSVSSFLPFIKLRWCPEQYIWR